MITKNDPVNATFEIFNDIHQVIEWGRKIGFKKDFEIYEDLYSEAADIKESLLYLFFEGDTYREWNGWPNRWGSDNDE